MQSYRYELIAVMIVLIGSILFSTLGIAETSDAKAEQVQPNEQIVSLN